MIIMTAMWCLFLQWMEAPPWEPILFHFAPGRKRFNDGMRNRGEAVTTGDGIVEFRDTEGRPHRDDGPAAIYPDGRRIWFVDGVKVREERV
jgi:hypothetical protein